MSLEAQEFEQQKDHALWLAIANDFVRNLEDEISSVLNERLP